MCHPISQIRRPKLSARGVSNVLVTVPPRAVLLSVDFISVSVTSRSTQYRSIVFLCNPEIQKSLKNEELCYDTFGHKS